MDISPADWQAFSRLAEEVDLPPERVPALRRRIESATSDNGRPFLLIAGLRGAGIERLLAGWIGERAVEALEAAGDRPLVIGTAAEKVQPSIGEWPVLKQPIPGCEAGHLVVVRADGVRLAADVEVGLGTLGCLEELILVTRLGQPLTQTEREFAHGFAPLAATARALVVGLPGESPGSSEMVRLAAYAYTRLRDAGFRDGRYLGSGVWFSDKNGGTDQSGAIEDVGKWMVVNRSEVENGRVRIFREAVGALLGEISLRTSRTPKLVPINEEECDRLARELEGHLAAVGRETARWVGVRSVNGLSTEVLETYLLDTLRGWGAYSGTEGTWLRYVERLRPGVQAALLAEASEAIKMLDLEMSKCANVEPSPSPESPVDKLETGKYVWLERAVIEAKLLAIAVIAGVLAYLLVGALPNAGVLSVDPLLMMVLRYVALVVVGLLSYRTARRFFPGTRPIPNSAEIPSRLLSTSLNGWTQVERRIVAWFRGQMEGQPVSPHDAVRSLTQRLGLEDPVSEQLTMTPSPGSKSYPTK